MPSMSRRVIFSKKKPSRPPLRRGDERPPAREDETMVEISAEERAARHADIAQRAAAIRPQRAPVQRPRFNARWWRRFGIVTGLSLLGVWGQFALLDLERYLQPPAYSRSANRQPSLDVLNSPSNRGRGTSPGVSAGAPGHGTGAGMGADGRPLPTDESFRATFNVHRKQGEPGAVPQDAPRIEVDGECAVTTSSTDGKLQGLDTCFRGGR